MPTFKNWRKLHQNAQSSNGYHFCFPSFFVTEKFFLTNSCLINLLIYYNLFFPVKHSI